MAVWAICHPSKVGTFQDIIQRLGYPPLKSGNVILKKDDLTNIQTQLGSDSSKRPYFEIIYQYSGHLINIPPGWAHMVINLHVRFKLSCFAIVIYSQS